MRSYSHERDVILAIKRVVSMEPHGYIQKLNLNYVHGFPDLVIGLAGETIFLEVKRWGGKFSKIQLSTLGRMRQAGMKAYGFVAKDEQTTKLVCGRTEHVGPLLENLRRAWRAQ